MNGSYITMMAILFSGLLIFGQRIEERHQKKWRRFVFVLAIALWLIRDHLRSETFIGVIIAMVISFLFWLVIGRYNPVGSSDTNIKVYGMDD